jgi:hypothetical protein
MDEGDDEPEQATPERLKEQRAKHVEEGGRLVGWGATGFCCPLCSAHLQAASLDYVVDVTDAGMHSHLLDYVLSPTCKLTHVDSTGRCLFAGLD